MIGEVDRLVVAKALRIDRCRRIFRRDGVAVLRIGIENREAQGARVGVIFGGVHYRTAVEAEHDELWREGRGDSAGSRGSWR